jgi:hypothetical protein
VILQCKTNLSTGECIECNDQHLPAYDESGEIRYCIPQSDDEFCAGYSFDPSTTDMDFRDRFQCDRCRANGEGENLMLSYDVFTSVTDYSRHCADVNSTVVVVPEITHCETYITQRGELPAPPLPVSPGNPTTYFCKRCEQPVKSLEDQDVFYHDNQECLIKNCDTLESGEEFECSSCTGDYELTTNSKVCYNNNKINPSDSEDETPLNDFCDIIDVNSAGVVECMECEEGKPNVKRSFVVDDSLLTITQGTTVSLSLCVDESIAHCTEYLRKGNTESDPICLECEKGWHVDQAVGIEGRKCIQDFCDSVDENGNCTTCKEGYFAFNESDRFEEADVLVEYDSPCVAKDEFPDCKIISQTDRATRTFECERCETTFGIFEDDGFTKCLAYADAEAHNCKTLLDYQTDPAFNYDRPVCFECLKPDFYELDNNEKHYCHVNDCLVSSKGHCVQCKAGF